MPRGISTVRGRELGTGVAAVVESAGLGSRGTAGRLGWDQSKLSHVVNGKGGISQLDLALLLGLCQAAPTEVARLMALFPTREQSGWWQQHGVRQPVHPRTAAENLKWATTLVSWNPHMVPVLLQTADYLRAVLQASATMPVDELEERVQARLAMQRALQARAARTFFVHELALRLPVGGTAVHAWQLQHLLAVANRPDTTVRIVPTALGAHAGMAGPFTRLTFAKYAPMVLVETENSSLFDEETDAVTGYGQVISALEKTSLDGEESKQLITRLSGRADSCGREPAAAATCGHGASLSHVTGALAERD